RTRCRLSVRAAARQESPTAAHVHRCTLRFVIFRKHVADFATRAAAAFFLEQSAQGWLVSSVAGVPVSDCTTSTRTSPGVKLAGTGTSSQSALRGMEI